MKKLLQQVASLLAKFLYSLAENLEDFADDELYEPAEFDCYG